MGRMSQEKAVKVIDLNKARMGAPSPVARDLGDLDLSASTGASAGEVLAAARKKAGLTLTAISAGTNVKETHLAAIEAGNTDELPAIPFAAGFVKAYASFLGLDGEVLAKQFRDAIKPVEREAPSASVSEPVAIGPSYANGGARLISFLAIAAIVVFAIWMAIQVVSPNNGDENRSASGPRVTLGAASATAAPTPRVFEAGEAGDAASGDDANAVVEPAPAPDLVERDSNGEIVAAASVAGASAVDDLSTPTLPREDGAAPNADDVIVAARLVRTKAPAYPVRCETGAGDRESVTVIFDVIPTGRVANARVASATDSCFNEAAVSAVRDWRFDPQTVNGSPRTEVGRQATLNFER